MAKFLHYKNLPIEFTTLSWLQERERIGVDEVLGVVVRGEEGEVRIVDLCVSQAGITDGIFSALVCG